jgi:hypothetical protein
VIPHGIVAGPEVENAAVGFAEVVFEIAEPGIAFVFVVAEIVSDIAELEIVFVVDPEVSEPGVDVVAVVPVANIAERQASFDIALAFDVLVPVPVVAVEVDSSGCPSFFAFPNIDPAASPSSFVEVVGKESVHSSTGVLANYGLCIVFSNLGPHQNKNLEHCYNKPNPDHNNVNNTNDLPMDATTNHSRKTGLHLYQELHTHRSFQASPPYPVVPEM